MSSIVQTDVIIEHLPGEPLRTRAPAAGFLPLLLARAMGVVVLAALSLLVCPLFLLGWLRWGWPPFLARPGRVLRALGRTATVAVPRPGLPPLSRAWLVVRLLEKGVSAPLSGLAWYLDELLFGRRLDQVSVDKPIVLLSAARSGSTQLGHYLEEDPEIVAPVVLQVVLPFLWLWHLAVPTLGRIVSRERLNEALDLALPLEMLQRHEGEPLRTDTFEVLWMMHGVQLLAAFLGPQSIRDHVSFMGTAAENRELWDHDFPAFLDRLGRKALLLAGPLPDGRTPRLFVKGHFLEARHAVARRWPGARFLTMVRDPVKRLESMINHLHANPVEEPLGPVPWSFITPALVESELAYCAAEQAFFTQPGHEHRLAIPFSDYVADLEGTMRRVYREVHGSDALPPHVPTEHAPRQRTNYVVHRSLRELGVDLAALDERARDYRAWCAALHADAGAADPGAADPGAAHTGAADA